MPASASSAQLDTTHVVTVEHLRGADGRLHPVQQAMVDFHGSQCGFCTPGFVMSLYGLWMRSPNPSDAAIEKSLQGNLCRCTGYEAIMRAARAISDYGKAAQDPLIAERKAIIAQLAAMNGEGAASRSARARSALSFRPMSTISPSCWKPNPTATVVAGSTDVGLWVTKHIATSRRSCSWPGSRV